MLLKNSTVIEFGKDCKVYNWKDSVKINLKQVGSGDFPFLWNKRFFIQRTKKRLYVVVTGDIHCRASEGVYKGI